MIYNLVWYILTNGRGEQSFLITPRRVTVTLNPVHSPEECLVDLSNGNVPFFRVSFPSIFAGYQKIASFLELGVKIHILTPSYFDTYFVKGEVLLDRVVRSGCSIGL